MIFEINVDDSELVPAVAKELSENWQSDICEAVAEKFDASDIAEHVSVWDIAHEIDMEEFYANFEIEYEDLANNIIDANNFKEMIAVLMWQKFIEEFGASMRCMREEIAVIHSELDARAVPFWKRWFNNGNKKEIDIA
jgi:hypothetical protein